MAHVVRCRHAYAARFGSAGSGSDLRDAVTHARIGRSGRVAPLSHTSTSGMLGRGARLARRVLGLPKAVCTSTCGRLARSCSGSSTGCPSTTFVDRWCRRTNLFGLVQHVAGIRPATSDGVRPAVPRVVGLDARRRTERRHVGEARRDEGSRRPSLSPGVGSLRHDGRRASLDALGEVPWWPEGARELSLHGRCCT